MKRILASNSAYGQGGIGQHFAQLVEESRQAGQLAGYYCPAPKPNDSLGLSLPAPRWHGWLAQYTPVRFSPPWKNHLLNDLYDRTTAAALKEPCDAFMGFVGKSLHSFGRARALGTPRLELVAANSHVDNLRRLHRRAAATTGLDDSWLNEAQRRKTHREYEAADRIYVHSDYTRQSFLDAGLPASKLVRTYLAVAPRFQPPTTRPSDDLFRIVYVGRVDATKGVPLLLDAFAELSIPAELTLVGSWATRQMRQYMNDRLQADARIRIAPGDPLPHLQAADVFVHPSFEDGFGYAPMEALACGTPVLVTADTGMKEYVHDGRNGYVVPTGSRTALLEQLHRLHDTPLAGTSSLLPATYYAEHRQSSSSAAVSSSV
ncbi:hypothetical protein BSZ35_08210 [Salinibacter sp. 10B]|uniref:glycosyltransferase family 4 protein n=1 Tax=Salinibacter sp. 10B TaxID=1923971 RepID=UPI000CF48BFB|nr:glycosyltransferase family 4 protein [Salinibacter sp. 10B]PQJ34584.1 hypothetical protein BSZ35_08210 [Salinibacter sp. 10B]